MKKKILIAFFFSFLLFAALPLAACQSNPVSQLSFAEQFLQNNNEEDLLAIEAKLEALTVCQFNMEFHSSKDLVSEGIYNFFTNTATNTETYYDKDTRLYTFPVEDILSYADQYFVDYLFTPEEISGYQKEQNAIIVSAYGRQMVTNVELCGQKIIDENVVQIDYNFRSISDDTEIQRITATYQLLLQIQNDGSYRYLSFTEEEPFDIGNFVRQAETISALLNGQQMPFDPQKPMQDGSPYFAVTSETYQSIEDIKAAAEQVFAKDYLEEKRYIPAFTGPQPYYQEKDHILYLFPQTATSEGEIYPNSVTLLEKNATEMKASLEQSIPGQTTTRSLIFQFIQTENGWRINQYPEQ